MKDPTLQPANACRLLGEFPPRQRPLVPSATGRLLATPARRWFWLAAPILATALLYAPIFPRLVYEWAQFSSLSYGFAIPCISAYLLWVRRARLRASTPTPSLFGLPVLMIGLAGLVIGVNGQESFVARISLPVTLLGLALFLGGHEVLRHTWMAIAYLAFMIPLPWTTLRVLSHQSRLLDAYVSTEALRWLGVPVYRDGFMLQLPRITLEVADVCSSIPALAALLALGVAYVAVTQRPIAVKALLVVATIPLAMFSNIIRITTTAAGVYYMGVWTLGTVYHQFNGTVNFLLTLVSLLLLDSLLRCARTRL
jgi:exosortase